MEYLSDGNWHSGIKGHPAESHLLVDNDVLHDLKARPYSHGLRGYDYRDGRTPGAEWATYWWVEGSAPRFHWRRKDSKALNDPLDLKIPQIPGRWVSRDGLFTGRLICASTHLIP
jgi:hypothetical protein